MPSTPAKKTATTTKSGAETKVRTKAKAKAKALRGRAQVRANKERQDNLPLLTPNRLKRCYRKYGIGVATESAKAAMQASYAMDVRKLMQLSRHCAYTKRRITVNAADVQQAAAILMEPKHRM